MGQADESVPLMPLRMGNEGEQARWHRAMARLSPGPPTPRGRPV